MTNRTRPLAAALLTFLAPAADRLGAQTQPATPKDFQPPVTPPAADFQPYIFWAYGLACLLIFAFSVWTLLDGRRVEARLRGLEARFAEKHPESPPPGSS